MSYKPWLIGQERQWVNQQGPYVGIKSIYFIIIVELHTLHLSLTLHFLLHFLECSFFLPGKLLFLRYKVLFMQHQYDHVTQSNLYVLSTWFKCKLQYKCTLSRDRCDELLSSKVSPWLPGSLGHPTGYSSFQHLPNQNTPHPTPPLNTPSSTRTLATSNDLHVMGLYLLPRLRRAQIPETGHWNKRPWNMMWMRASQYVSINIKERKGAYVCSVISFSTKSASQQFT